MEPARPTPRLKLPTAKWGAACAPCATAKAKCIRSNPDEAAKCDRCQRLYKDCCKQVHRPRKKRVSKPSRTTQLESKLNGLVNYLKVSGEWEKASSDLDGDTSYGTASSEPTTYTSTYTSPSESIGESFRSASTSQWAVPPTYNMHAPASCICRADPEDAPPPPDTDEALLEIFKSQFTSIHPFVVIPAETSAAELNATRPFLMSAIRMVTSYRSLKSMRAQMYRIMVYLSDHMMIRSERSMDLLLGLIVVIGWYQYHCFMHAQLNNLISLACSLCAELNLNRDPSYHERTLLMVVRPSAICPRTNEERRAFAGVWFLSSAMSIGFTRIESLRYTYYLDECVKYLEESGEYSTDERLVYMVRIQHLTERITRLSSNDKTLEEVTNSPAAPMSAYISAFQTELDNLQKSIPIHLKEDQIILTYLNTAKLRLHEPPAVDSELLNAISESLASPHPGPGSPLDRIYQSANALRDWFDHWLTVPVDQYHLHTTSIGSQIVYALVMLSRWARLATPRRMYGPDTPMPEDPSRRPFPYEQGPVTPHSTDSQSFSSDTKATRRADPSNGVLEPCLFDPVYVKANVDPTLPGAVALLRSRLKQQHGLKINIPLILSSVYTRFEQASDALQTMSVEEGKVEHNIWSMGAVKMKITQAKLEKWAELVSAKTEALSLSEQKHVHAQAPGDAAMYDHTDTYDAGMTGMTPMEVMGMPPGLGETDQWMAEVMGGVDPSIWFDGYVGDWGQMVVNSSGELQG